jgi:dTDP-glucose pyrophosphorylase
LVVGYRGEAIRSYFGDGAAWDVRIDYAEQPVPTGTGVAVLLSQQFAREQPFLCSVGDILTAAHHYGLLRADFSGSPCAAVLGINPVDDPSAGGAVYRDGNQVTRVVEKPPAGTSLSNWNLAGINVFGPEIFDALSTVTPSPRGEIEITSGYSALIDAGHEVRAVEMHGFWSDVGTPEALEEAERLFRA